jgi:hypothetical protein
MARWTQVAAKILRETFAREELPEAPPATPRPPRRSMVAALFAPEPLPPPPVDTAPSTKGSRGPLALLFAPEPLPEDPPGSPRARGRWLAWLFAPERLDD